MLLSHTSTLLKYSNQQWKDVSLRFHGNCSPDICSPPQLLTRHLLTATIAQPDICSFDNCSPGNNSSDIYSIRQLLTDICSLARSLALSLSPLSSLLSLRSWAEMVSGQSPQEYSPLENSPLGNTPPPPPLCNSPRVIAPGNGPRQWPLAMAPGNGPRQWPPAIAPPSLSCLYDSPLKRKNKLKKYKVKIILPSLIVVLISTNQITAVTMKLPRKFMSSRNCQSKQISIGNA